MPDALTQRLPIAVTVVCLIASRTVTVTLSIKAAIMSSEYSSLAADSAKLSLKRTRELFDRSATNAFLPSTDAQLYQASLTRRLKTQYSVEGNKKAPTKSSDALVLSTVRDDDEQQEETATGGGVLVTRSEEPPTPKQSADGILVVRSPVPSV
jgi:hypothetical protein